MSSDDPTKTCYTIGDIVKITDHVTPRYDQWEDVKISGHERMASGEILHYIVDHTGATVLMNLNTFAHHKLAQQ